MIIELLSWLHFNTYGASRLSLLRNEMSVYFQTSNFGFFDVQSFKLTLNQFYMLKTIYLTCQKCKSPASPGNISDKFFGKILLHQKFRPQAGFSWAIFELSRLFSPLWVFLKSTASSYRGS